MPENQYKDAVDKEVSVAEPKSLTGWRTMGGTHSLAPDLFSINETQRRSVNSGSCSSLYRLYILNLKLDVLQVML